MLLVTKKSWFPSVLILGLGTALFFGCGAPKTEPVRVFAAASTREALEEIAEQFRTRTGMPVELNFAASSELARQIEHGADADVFLSADEAWADHLAARDLVDRRRDLLTNELVVAVSVDSNLELRELADLASPNIRRVALAGSAVPAGHYAREALTRAGVWERIKDRVIEGADVRGTLAFVTRGEAEAGFVYATDLTANPKVKLALRIKPQLHAPILYPLALVRQPAVKPGAALFYDHLGSEDAAKVFLKLHFGMASAQINRAPD
jgi:molybdate transport system substrate-binding protein